MGKEKILRKVKLSDIKSTRVSRYYWKSKLKNLTQSIKKDGYSPEKHNKRIILMTWGKSVAPSYVNTIKNKQYSIWDGHHRVKVLKEIHPPDYEIEVEIRQVYYGLKILLGILTLGIVVGVIWLLFSSIWILLVALTWGILREIKYHLTHRIKK